MIWSLHKGFNQTMCAQSGNSITERHNSINFPPIWMLHNHYNNLRGTLSYWHLLVDREKEMKKGMLSLMVYRIFCHQFLLFYSLFLSKKNPEKLDLCTNSFTINNTNLNLDQCICTWINRVITNLFRTHDNAFISDKWSHQQELASSNLWYLWIEFEARSQLFTHGPMSWMMELQRLWAFVYIILPQIPSPCSSYPVRADIGFFIYFLPNLNKPT